MRHIVQRIKSIVGPRLSLKDKTLFVKRLSYLVKGGVPILESLQIIRRGTKSPSKAKIYDTMIENVSNGQLLSSGFAVYKNIFGDFAVNIVRIGETSGILHQNLHYLAEELRKKHILKKKIWSALAYPILISLATLGIAAMLTLYIFPKILPIFKSLKVGLPLSTRILIGTSEFLQNFGLLLLSAIVVAIVSFIVLRKTVYPFQFFIDKMILYIPLMGKLIISYNVANFCRTMGLLLQSEISIIEAMRMTANTTQNLAYKNEFKRIADELTKGESLSRNLAMNGKLFPYVLPELVTIGETTGTLPETLIYLSDLHENEVDDFTKSLSSSLEPILMLTMGVIVGFIAISVITPIYQITQGVRP